MTKNNLANLFHSLPVMILMRISSYLILEAEHATMPEVHMQSDMAGHRILPLWHDRLPGVFGQTAVFHIGAVGIEAVLFFARYATHIIRTLDRREVRSKQQGCFPDR